MLSTPNLKLLNQSSNKFRSRYIGPYKVIDKISSQAYKFELPTSMKIHPVFHISLVKEFNSLSLYLEIPDDIPSYSNYFVYGDDMFYAHSIVEHKITPNPATYAKGPTLLFKVKWEGYDSSEDSWEPYENVKRTDCFDDYYKHSDKIRLLIRSNEYKKLSSSYSSRFPKVFGPVVSS
jgi:hypothetical protein